jgi:polyphenol oxidase
MTYHHERPDPERLSQSSAGGLPPASRWDEPVLTRFGLFAKYPNLVSGMSTRKGGVSPEPFGMNTSFSVNDDPDRVRLNRERFLRELGISEDRLAVPSQVHGDTVRLVTEPGRYESCDGLITRSPGLFLSVSVADCLPIFLNDPVRETVGLVHAGWRGTKLNILSHALRIFAEESTRPEDLFVCIGPGAGACCYEVGEEVAREFDAVYVHRIAGRKPHLDLKAVNRSILVAAGVPDGQIEVSAACTICSAELFHSYRRDGKKSGRMMGVIGRL